jgi:prevent-host-death family protein
MQPVSIDAAKTNLSKPIDAALAGDDVVIAKGNKRVARLVPIAQGRFQIGLLKAELAGTGPDFLGPMDADDLALWDGDA